MIRVAGTDLEQRHPATLLVPGLRKGDSDFGLEDEFVWVWRQNTVAPTAMHQDILGRLFVVQFHPCNFQDKRHQIVSLSLAGRFTPYTEDCLLIDLQPVFVVPLAAASTVSQGIARRPAHALLRLWHFTKGRKLALRQLFIAV